MLSEALGLELEDLTTLQRKLLIELLQRSIHNFGTASQTIRTAGNAGKKALKSLYKITKLNSLEFANNNGWKTTRMGIA